MAEPTSADPPQVPSWTPPGWVNAVVNRLLRTPGIERWLGSYIALIAFKGRRTGRLYATPVTYHRDGVEVIIVTKRGRVWWRNLLDDPRVVLRLAGCNVQGVARVLSGGDERLSMLLRFLDHRRLDARAYGLEFDEAGRIDPDRVRAVLPQIVVIRVTLVPALKGK